MLFPVRRSSSLLPRLLGLLLLALLGLLVAVGAQARAGADARARARQAAGPPATTPHMPAR